MKTIGTDGKTYQINLSKNERETEDENRSSLHLRARKILKSKFPYVQIYEEVTLTGCRGVGATLVADFLIPSMNILVEVHGAQHYEFTKFYHKTEANFDIHKKNDAIKEEWAKNNNIKYIVLPYNETKRWGAIIDGCVG